jgi:hypothetical protein
VRPSARHGTGAQSTRDERDVVVCVDLLLQLKTTAHLYYGNGDSWDEVNKLGRLWRVGVEGRVQGFASNRGKIEGPRPGQSLV